jgi:hypothetical protein
MKFFQVWEEIARSSGGATQPLDRSNRSGPLVLRPGGAQEEPTEEETDSRRISYRNPVSRWIGRSCVEFSLWRRSAQKNRSEPLDLSRDPDSRRICGSYMEVKSSWIGGESRREESSSGYRPSGNRSSRGRENRDIESLEIPTRSEPSS